MAADLGRLRPPHLRVRLRAHPPVMSPFTERELQDAIIDMARLLGWHIHHQRPARTQNGWRSAIQGHAGFPDLVLLRPPRLVFAELKTVKGKVHFDQATWLNGLETVQGVEQYLWRPQDWETGAVESVLR